MSINYVVTPGDYLQEWLDDTQLTQEELAKRLGVSRKLVNEVINGRASVSPRMAGRLGRVTNIPSEGWLEYEARYQSERERIKEQDGLAQHADCISPQLGSYLRDMGVTKATRRNPGKLVEDFLQLHHFGSFEAYQQSQKELFQGDFGLATLRESRKHVDPFALTAWMALGDETPVCQDLQNVTYDPERLRNIIPELRQRACVQDDSLIMDMQQTLLKEAGVVLLVVPPPKRFPLHGVTRWHQESVPIIQQTLRWKDDGFFIWTLFHELGHVLRDTHRSYSLDFGSSTGLDAMRKANEKQANDFARQALFGPEGIGQVCGDFHYDIVKEKAAELGIPLGAVVHEIRMKRIREYKWGSTLLQTLDFDHQMDWAKRDI